MLCTSGSLIFFCESAGQGEALDVNLLSSGQEIDGPRGVFGLKMWTYRVLLELIHWADHATQTLHILHTERGGTEEI